MTKTLTPFTILEIQLSVAFENIINGLGHEHEVEVLKDEEHYRLNFLCNDERIGVISINGKGLEVESYHRELLEICFKYMTR